MKALLTLLLIFLSMTFVHAQEEENTYEYDSLPNHTYNCGWNKSLSIEERNKIFPFSEAKKIILISYANYDLRYTTKEVPGKSDNLPHNATLKQAKRFLPHPVIRKWSFKIKDSSYNLIYFSHEEKVLTDKEVNQLSDLFFNYTLPNNAQVNPEEQIYCYTPRNAILFLNDKEEIVACIEVCFSCRRMKFFQSQPLKDWIINFNTLGCEKKFELLKSFFIENGINFGAVTVD